MYIQVHCHLLETMLANLLPELWLDFFKGAGTATESLSNGSVYTSRAPVLVGFSKPCGNICERFFLYSSLPVYYTK